MCRSVVFLTLIIHMALNHRVALDGNKKIKLVLNRTKGRRCFVAVLLWAD